MPDADRDLSPDLTKSPAQQAWWKLDLPAGALSYAWAAGGAFWRVLAAQRFLRKEVHYVAYQFAPDQRRWREAASHAERAVFCRARARSVAGARTAAACVVATSASAYCSHKCIGNTAALRSRPPCS